MSPCDALISIHCVLHAFDDFFPLNLKLWPFLGTSPAVHFLDKMIVKHTWSEKVLEVQFPLRRGGLTLCPKEKRDRNFVL